METDTESRHEAIISFTRKRELKYTEAGNVVRDCTLDDGGNAVCFICPDTDDSQYLYKFYMTNTSPYMLRMFCKGKTDDGRLYFVSESFDCTLAQWSKRVLKNGDWLEEGFITILQDIMQGIVYFHKKLNQRNGEIYPGNIYIVDGQAKLGNVLHKSYEKKLVDDYTAFSALVINVFKRIEISRVDLPYELNHFVELTKKTHNPSQFAYMMNHPVLLNPKQRCHMRDEAKFIAVNEGLTKQVHSCLRGILPKFDWKARVSREEVRSLQHYDTFGQGPVAFSHISRNSCHHINEPDKVMSFEQIENELNAIWPEFLCALFDACYQECINLTALWQKQEPLRP